MNVGIYKSFSGVRLPNDLNSNGASNIFLEKITSDFKLVDIKNVLL